MFALPPPFTLPCIHLGCSMTADTVFASGSYQKTKLGCIYKRVGGQERASFRPQGLLYPVCLCHATNKSTTGLQTHAHTQYISDIGEEWWERRRGKRVLCYSC